MKCVYSIEVNEEICKDFLDNFIIPKCYRCKKTITKEMTGTNEVFCADCQLHLKILCIKRNLFMESSDCGCDNFKKLNEVCD